MPASLGPVLTSTPSLAGFMDYCKPFTTAKVVTGWGLPEGWGYDHNRCRMLVNTPELIVRTTEGDPSTRNANWYLDPGTVVDELKPWLALKDTLHVELGNEPDVYLEDMEEPDEYYIWVYTYWLHQTLDRLRHQYPQAYLIGPSPRVDVPGWDRWLRIMAPALRRCDAVSLHIYGWHRFWQDKGEPEQAFPLYEELFGSQPIYITELGINDPAMADTRKLNVYQTFTKTVPTTVKAITYFHYDVAEGFHKDYHISDSAVKQFFSIG